ncbi:MAG: hypothetical protein AAB855_02460, partial [Patescibacteria group bacterium]
TKLRWNICDQCENGWKRMRKYRAEYNPSFCNFHNDDQFDARAIVSCDRRVVPIGIAHRKDVSAAENADPHMRDGGYECQLMMNANLQKEMAVYWSQVWTCMIFPSGTTNRKIDHARMTVDTHGQTKIADFMASNYVDDARMYYQDLCK